MIRMLNKASVLLLAAITTVAAGCGEEEPTVIQVQPNALSKDMFEGEWYLHRTVIDTPYTNGATFVGEGTAIHRIKWEIQKDVLIARTTYQHIDGSEDTAISGAGASQSSPIAMYAITSHFDIRRAYNPSTGEETNVLTENSSDRPWYERKYFRVDWSANLISDEDTSLTSKLAGVTLEPVNYYIEDPADPWAPRFEKNDDGDVYYMDIVNKYFAEPTSVLYDFGGGDIRKIPACYFIFNMHMDCQPGEVAVRSSYLKVDPQHDYQPMEYTENRMDSFGFFLTHRDGYSRDYGTAAVNRTRFVNRHNIWQHSYYRDDNGLLAGCVTTDDCRAAGAPAGSVCDQAIRRAQRGDYGACTIPYQLRTVSPVTYHLSEGFPEDLLPDAQAFADDWNEAFQDTVASLRVLECEDHGLPAGSELSSCEDWREPENMEDVYVLCSNPVPAGAPAACGKEGEVARIGDIRYNLVGWVDEPNLASPLGYGPSYPDPLTGEIISATGFVYGAGVDTLANYARDLVALINGDLSTDDLVDNDAFGDWIEGMTDPAFTQASVREANRHAVPIDGYDAPMINRSMTHDWMFDLMNVDRDAIKPPDAKHFMQHWEAAKKNLIDAVGDLRMGDTAHARLEALKGTEIEDMLINDEAIIGAGFAPGTQLTDQVREAASPLRGMSIKQLKGIKQLQTQLTAKANGCILNADFVDDGLLGLVREINRAVQNGGTIEWYGESYDLTDEDGNIDYTLVAQMLRHPIFNAVTAHEIGHTLGLRHNFSGSFDSLNYHKRYWELRDDGDMKSRAWDPMSEKEINGRIREYQYSTVMDYGHNFVVTDAEGIGKYDRAAIKMGYGDIVEVFTDVPAANRTLFAGIGALQGFGWPGALDVEALIAGRPLRMIPYVEIPELLGGVESLEKRKDVKFTSLVDGTGELQLGVPTADPDGNPVVPYRYCGDEFADFQPNCLRYDAGADEYETVLSIIDSYWNYYLFNNFMRQRLGFDPDTVPARVYSRYFDKLMGANAYYTYFRGILEQFGAGPGFFDSQDGFGAFTTAVGASYQLLTKVVATPEPGNYAQSSLMDGTPFLTASSGSFAFGGGTEISNFDGRRLRTGYDLGPDSSFWYLIRAGYFMDKALAMQVLTDPGVSLLGQDTNADLREFQISFYTTFQDGLSSSLRAVIGNDWVTYAPRYNNGELLFPNVDEQAHQSMDVPVEATIVDPNIGFSLQLYAMLYGTALLPRNFDQSFVDRARLFVKGGAESVELELPAGSEMIEFVDDDSGLVYMAPSYKDEDGHEIGVAAQMLLHAQELKDNEQEAELQLWMDNLNILRRLIYLTGFGSSDDFGI